MSTNYNKTKPIFKLRADVQDDGNSMTNLNHNEYHPSYSNKHKIKSPVSKFNAFSQKNINVV